jgi:plastocyanin
MGRPVILALAAAVVLLAAGNAFSASQATPKLNGTVGPGFTISLKMNGKAVKTLKAGMYSFVIADKSSIHNFVVEKSGGGFEKALTTVPLVGTKTVTVKLTKGKWEFYCKPHEATMHGDFTVS